MKIFLVQCEKWNYYYYFIFILINGCIIQNSTACQDTLKSNVCERINQSHGICSDETSPYRRVCCATCNLQPNNSPECGQRFETKTFFNSGTVLTDFLKKNSFENKIFGGVEAEINSWPWMALIGIMKRGRLTWICGGTLINDKWVLTAAHCLQEGERLTVRLGEHNVSKVDPKHPTQDILVEESIAHPAYRASQKYHDIALLKLRLSRPLDKRFRPVCLPTEGLFDVSTGKDAVVTGWGAQAFLGEFSTVLREGYLRIFDTKRCSDAYSRNQRDFSENWPDGMDSRRILCAGHPQAETDACQGDSGGPFMISDHEKYILIGVVSSGFGCGHKDYPGLYIPIYQPEYLNWIKRTTI